MHATGGLLVKLAEEAAFQTDLRPDDRLFWVTDLGWLMGIWEIVGANSLGGAVVVAEGRPTPPPDRVWSLCERHRRLDSRPVADARPRPDAIRRRAGAIARSELAAGARLDR